MSRAAAENEDLAPRAVSCHLCIEAPHSRANEEFDRVSGFKISRAIFLSPPQCLHSSFFS